MSNGPSAVLSFDEIDAIVRDVIADGKAGWTEATSQKMQPLRTAQHHQPDAVTALLWLVQKRSLPWEAAADVLAEIAESHDKDVEILSRLGLCLEAARDVDDLNAPPPDHPVFRSMVERLGALAKIHEGQPQQEEILRGLATSARMLARQQDAIAESSYRKLTEIDPRSSAHHYNLGLFYKTRGRFAEGVMANQIAASLAQEVDESYEWNLGICATGARQAEIALDVWKRMEQEIETGRFGLPEGLYHSCKVKLAERPLAERTADRDDPGKEETVWIERLSPCHGIIRSVLYGKLGVDYGDVILMDGAPITHHTYGEEQIPVFPHLATLLRRNYQFFDFAGAQETAGQLTDANEYLDEEVVIYSHSENVKMMCANCWRDPDIDHARHERMEKHVVTGRIAAPPDIAPARLLELIDQAIEKQGRSQLYSPDLCAAAGLTARERIDRRRFLLLTRN
jgi:hypothetical protein